MAECPPEIKKKLQMQREACRVSQRYQQWLCDWWAGLLPDDRRLLLALTGLDDGADVARRRLEQFRPVDRDKLLTECKRVRALLDPVKWA